MGILRLSHVDISAPDLELAAAYYTQVLGLDLVEGEGVVSVLKVNGHAKKAGWKGTDVTFDFSEAQIRVEDKNLDGVADIGDFAVGDAVRVKARLPKGDPGEAPYKAQRLDDRSASSDDD